MAKVAAAFFAFLEVQPGAHEAFNAWHLYDHVPENIALPGIARGERWAHTPDCVAARLHADESLAKTSYLVQYLFEEPVERTLEKFMDLGARMDGIGRFDRHFKMTMGGPFRLVKGYASPRAVVSPEAIPFRPATGVIAVVSDLTPSPFPGREGEEQRMRNLDAVDRWYDEIHIPNMLTVEGVAGAQWFVSHEYAGYRRGANPPGRAIRLMWLDRDPVEVMASLAKQRERWRAAGQMRDLRAMGVKTLFSGPFRTVPAFEDVLQR